MIRTGIGFAIGLAIFGAVPDAFAGEGTRIGAHQFSFSSADGEKIDLADYAGKIVLVVNTASQCSFTEQYGPLQKLYEKYKDRGFVVIAVPSNDFGAQEPGSSIEAAEFAEREFSVDFPITAKASVIGSRVDPFYAWAANEVGPLGKPRWNFHKYLLGPDGRMINWFSSITQPDSKKLSEAIEAALETRASMISECQPD